MDESGPVTISLLVTPHSTASTFYGLLDVLGAAGSVWETHIMGRAASPKFAVSVVAAEEGPFQCIGGNVVTADRTLENYTDTDIVLVSSLNVPADTPTRFDPVIYEWLHYQHSRGALLACACTGALLFAQCGFLDGYEATTHYAYGDLFRVHYPTVKMKLAQNLCLSGPDNRIVTSGGAKAWEELALYLITRYCGVEEAVRTAKWWLMPRPDTLQMPYMTLSKGIAHDDSTVNEAQEWIAESYHISNPVGAMVERANLPATTFSRRFKLATGYRPMEYVHLLRGEKAKQLLESNNDPIDEVGRVVGYEDPASFRRIFKRVVGMTPGAYRRRFNHARFRRDPD